MQTRKNGFSTCALMLFFIHCVVGQTNVKREHTNKSSPQTVGMIFTNITQTQDKCVLISGYFQFNNNFFVNSCVDEFSVKENSSVGYVQDLYFTNEDSGWMILSHSLVKVDNNKIVDIDLNPFENKYFEKVLFVSSQKGWAIGSRGLIISTEDGGISWTKQIIDGNYDLEQIVFSNPEKGWIISSLYKDGLKKDSIVFKTIDGGKVWTKLIQIQGEQFEKIFFLDSQIGWAINGNGKIFKTDDGKVWKKKSLDKLNFIDVFFVDKFSGWGITDKKFFKTDDGGLTWKVLYTLPSVFPYDFSRVIFVDKFSGWLWSENKILQTKDGGMTWQSLDIKTKLSKDFIK